MIVARVYRYIPEPRELASSDAGGAGLLYFLQSVVSVVTCLSPSATRNAKAITGQNVFTVAAI